VKHGLLGKSLSHSHSPMIHRALGCADFSLVETDDPGALFASKDFESLMVTIPYKETVLPFLNEWDETARAIGAVNLIVNDNGVLKGYNTDAYGLTKMIESSGIAIQGRPCVVIGHGGAAKCARFVLRSMGAASVRFLVRNPKQEDDVAFDQIAKVRDAQVLLNATPIGMHPHEDDALPFALKTFKDLAVFYDLVYNPLQTPWRQEAKALGIPSFHGLPMLVHQASLARSIVDKTKLDDALAESVLRRLYRSLSNIVLIGLPLSGKSKVAELLSKLLGLTLLDSDKDIEAHAGKSIEAIFREDGEAIFRQKELAWAKAHAHVRGSVISTGGGMIENPEIIRLLQRHGFLVFLDKDPATVYGVASTGRPLLQSEDAFVKLHARRHPLYLQAADLTIPAESPKETILRLIEVKWNEAAHR
jgi:shikimate dehydrogenase